MADNTIVSQITIKNSSGENTRSISTFDNLVMLSDNVNKTVKDKLNELTTTINTLSNSVTKESLLDTIPDATTIGKGLMSAADKGKLDNLNNYTLPVATASVLGGVKIGQGLSIANGVLSTSIPIANDTVAGLVKMAPDMGIKISPGGILYNTGVRDLGESGSNGYILANVNGQSKEVPVKGWAGISPETVEPLASNIKVGTFKNGMKTSNYQNLSYEAKQGSLRNIEYITTDPGIGVDTITRVKDDNEITESFALENQNGLLICVYEE